MRTESTKTDGAPVVLAPRGPSPVETAIQAIARVIKQGYCTVSLFSGGKDSSVVTILAMEAIRRLKAEGYLLTTHYVSSSSTGLENPEIDHNLLEMHAAIEAFVVRHGLPVEVRMVYPALPKTFQVSTIGRGTLPRFIENGGKHRSCSVDWKVLPQQRLASELRAQSLADGHRETLSLLGTRFDESSQRGANMRRRGEDAAVPVANKDGFLTLSPIADWTESQVWDFLVSFLDQELQPFESFMGEREVRRLLDVYRDGNEGTCGLFMADGDKAPCGSRFGCWACTLTGAKDRSMESLLSSDPKYGYMQGLNDFRNYLIATQWDMSTRELIGRTVSPAGYLGVRPDVYNLAMRRRLLQYMLTLDAEERERAEQVQAALESGELEPTEHNVRMSDVQFELISYSQLVMVDFYWSMHSNAGEAFPALSIWFDVFVLGRRYPVPRIAITPKGEIGPKRWYRVGSYDAEFPVDGLRDYAAEQWNPYRHAQRADSYRELDGERLVWFDSDKRLGVDAAAAMLFIEGLRDSDFIIRARMHSAIESARFWLNEGIVTLPGGMVAKYVEMAKRGQYFSRFIDVENMTPAEVDAHLLAHSISDKEHSELLQALGDKAKRPSLRPVHSAEQALPPLGGLFAMLDELPDELPGEPADEIEISSDI